MINKTRLKTEIEMIESRKLQTEDFEIDYIFYQISSAFNRNYFAVEILLDDEASLAVLGEDREDAYSFYLESINGAVTPCGLTHIIADRINSTEY